MFCNTKQQKADGAFFCSPAFLFALKRANQKSTARKKSRGGRPHPRVKIDIERKTDREKGVQPMPVFLGIVIALLVGAAGAAGGYLYRKQGRVFLLG